MFLQMLLKHTKFPLSFWALWLQWSSQEVLDLWMYCMFPRATMLRLQLTMTFIIYKSFFF